MLMTHTQLDLAAYNGEANPHDVIQRQQGETWLVPHSPILMEGPIDWHIHKKEMHVYIPLIPYLVLPAPELAMAFMFQLGCRVRFDIECSIRRLHMVTGHPAHEMDAGELGVRWQMQLGFGLVLDN